MVGLLINKVEHRELEYLIKRELEELLMDLDDHRIDHTIKQAMRERYVTLFQLFRRVASEQECIRYMPKKSDGFYV